jgi:hypothetical protein
LFEANVSGTNGKPQGGLGGDRKKPEKGASSVALRYHKFAEFKNLRKDQQDELVDWNEVNGRGKGEKGGGKGGKGGKRGSPGGSPRYEPTKKLKSTISKMEACQTKMYEAMVMCKQQALLPSKQTRLVLPPHHGHLRLVRQLQLV